MGSWRPITEAELSRLFDQQYGAPDDAERKLFDSYQIRPWKAVIRRSEKAGDEQVISAPPRFRIDPPNHLGEEFAVKIGKKQADGVRAANAEAARDAVRSEMQRLTGLHHASGCRLANWSLAIENSGDSCHRDAGLRGDFFNGDAAMQIRHECNRLHSRRVSYCSTLGKVNVKNAKFFDSPPAAASRRQPGTAVD